MQVNKTIVIWNQFENGIQYFVLDGDYSRFNKIFIGEVDNEELQDELADMLYTEDGEDKGNIKFLDEFPTYVFYEEYNETLGSVIVIECGYIP